MTKIRIWLKGKKTYLTAAIGVVGALIAWADGSIGSLALATAVWAALQTCFIRAGVGNGTK